MPELPEVHTTVEGLKKVIIGKTIKEVWTDFYVGAKYGNRENIKNKKYFEKFRKIIKGAKIKSLERRGKNILINLNNRYTIVVHMKMTGHILYGKYKYEYRSTKYEVNSNYQNSKVLDTPKGSLRLVPPSRWPSPRACRGGRG